MDKNSEAKGYEPTPGLVGKGRFLGWPATRLGWWAVGLTIGSWLLPLLTGVMNLLATSLSGGVQTAFGVFGLLMVLCEIAGGIIGVVAVAKKKERSILVWFAILAGLGAILLMAGEFIFPH